MRITGDVTVVVRFGAVIAALLTWGCGQDGRGVESGRLTGPSGVSLEAPSPAFSGPSGWFGAEPTVNPNASADFARCVGGESGARCFSATALRVVASAVAPSAPGNLASTVGGSTVQLTWTAPSSGDPVVTYMIEAGSAPGLADLANFPTGSAATIFSAPDVPAGTYFVRIRAVSAGGTSGPSNEAVVVVAGVLCPGAPSGLTILSNSGGSIALAWVAGSNSPTSYIIEAGSAPGLANLANSPLGAATTFSTTGVAAGTYYVRVRARNACGTSGPSNEIILTVTAAALPNVTGTWTLTRTGSQTWITTYSSFTVTLLQSGSSLTGSMTPTGSRSTPIVFGTVSSSGVVFFGSESPYWNDASDGYFRLTLDSSGTRMSGPCNNTFTCTSATAVKR